MTCCDTKQAPVSNPGFGRCAPGALSGGLTRTRFFDGMILTQADLENEQRFWRLKRRLTNRALGAGVVWGLRLRWDARRHQFTLGPGYALDCCGNDLVVECPVVLAESELSSQLGASQAQPSSGFTRAPLPGAAITTRQACVVLQYVECPEQPRPVQVDACTPPTDRCEPSRVRETTRLLLVPPPPALETCLDDFFADLDDLKNSITDVRLRDALFPPAAEPTSSTAQSLLPATLRVVTPGSGDHTELVVQPPVTGTIAGESISGTRTPSGLRAGVVQFELRPLSGWGFSQGQVKQGDTVVDMVSPPVDLQQFWSLEVTLPKGEKSVTEQFAYTVDGLAYEQLFGDRPHGLAELKISGTVVVSDGGQQVVTTVSELRIDVKASVGQAVSSRSCLDALLPYGWLADPSEGARDAKLLLLAAIYAYLVDVTQESGGGTTQTRALAAALYTLVWRALGVQLAGADAQTQEQELARILARLFQCWCDAMLYPGPRCANEHHGVVLGTATLAPGGQILGFDMWEQRRQVVTGPWLSHVAGAFGLAPLDVVASRLAQAVCCVAAQPLPKLTPRMLGTRSLTHLQVGRGALSVGASVADTPAREVGVGELVRRMVGAFVAESTAPLARFTSIVDGTRVELLAPAADAQAADDAGKLDDLVGALLARDAQPLGPVVNLVARAASSELARELPPTWADLKDATATLAKSVAADGASLASVVEAGAAGLWTLSPAAEPSAVEELSTRAQGALASLVEGVSQGLRKAKLDRPAAMLRNAKVRSALAGELARRFTELSRAHVDAALERAAARLP